MARIDHEAKRRSGECWITVPLPPPASFREQFSACRLAGLPDMPVLAKEKAKSFTWADLEMDQSKAIGAVIDLTNFPTEEAKKCEALLSVAAKAYARRRSEEAFWKECEGKQVLSDVAKAVGFAGVSAMTQATFAAWSRGSAPVPSELNELRQHLSTL